MKETTFTWSIVSDCLQSLQCRRSRREKLRKERRKFDSVAGSGSTSDMSLSSNRHRLSESNGMIVDCPSQKPPTLNITRAVRISSSDFWYQLPSLLLGEAIHVRGQQPGVPRLLQQLSTCWPLPSTGRNVASCLQRKIFQTAFQVVCKGQQQMGKLVTAQGFVSENLRKYVKVGDRKYALV